MGKNLDVVFLQSYLQKLQGGYETIQELLPCDMSDGPVETTEDDERAARIADRYGFDGNCFRHLTRIYPSRSGEDLSILTGRLWKQINTIPRLIAAIDACEPFQDRVENGTAQEGAGKKRDDEPPAEILVNLGHKEGPLLRELWKHGSVNLDHLCETVWKDDPVEPASIIKCARRLGEKIFARGWIIRTANGCITLDR